MSNKHVIVVGAGASGLMAAGTARAAGAEVMLLERMREPGRKLRLCGKGRCNLTNTADTSDFIERFGRNGRFLYQALARFSPDDLVTFFAERGLSTVVERGGRIFPSSGRAISVVETLNAWVKELGVKMITGVRVRGLDVADSAVTGLHYDLFSEHGKSGSGGHRGCHNIEAGAVVLATGGKSYPATGSSGDGYDIAAALGHNIITPRPRLVPLKVEGGPPRGTANLSLRSVKATLRVDGKPQGCEFGELQFTRNALAGPIILKLSGLAVDALAAKEGSQRVELSLDLKPALDDKVLDARLIRDLESRKIRCWGDLLAGLLPSALIPTCLDACGVLREKTSHQIKSEERKRLRSWLKDVRFVVTGHGSFKEAIVTAGGVDTRQVNPRDMASRLVAGLFIVGELLDLDADTGGFNLQAAFSTGWVGGRAAAKCVGV